MPGLFDGYEQFPGLFGAPGSPVPQIAAPPPAPPVAPGIRPAVPVPAAPSARPSILSALGGFLGGPADPNLSAAANQQAGRDAMLRAGLAILAGSGPSAEPKSFGQILASGILAGQQAGAQSRTALAQQAQQQRLREIVQSGAGPDQLLQMYQQQVLTGDAEGARATATILQSVIAAGSKGQGNLQRFSGPDGTMYTFDPSTGEAKPIQGPDGKPLASATELESKDLGDRVVWYPKGHPERIVQIQPKGSLSAGNAFNPATDPVLQRKAYEKAHGLVPEKPLTQAQATIASILPSAELGMKAVDEVMAKLGGTVPLGTKAGEIPFFGPYFQSQDFQTLRTGMKQAALAVARMQGGANLTESEVAHIAEQYIPEPGDKEETVRQKLTALQTAIRAARSTLPEKYRTSATATQYSPDNPFR